MIKLFIFLAILIVLIIIYLLYLVKTKKLRTEYSILWILSLVIVLGLTFSVGLLDKIAYFLGIAYPPALILVVAIILGILILLNITQILSRFFNEKKNLMQRFVISQLKDYKKDSDILIIIPAYNEEKNIDQVVKNIRENYDYDILVINDGSQDKTEDILEKINCPHLNLTYNSGYGVALETGYKFASKYNYNYIIQFDADGQHDISSIKKLVDKIEYESQDVVIGSRFLNRNDYKAPFARKIGMQLFRITIKIITGRKMTDPTSGLQILRKNVFSFFSKNNRFPTKYPDADMIVLLHKNNFKVDEVGVKMHLNAEGKSMHSGFIRPFIYVIQMYLSIFVILLSRKE